MMDKSSLRTSALSPRERVAEGRVRGAQ
jgi:hypothetical protein